jgi:hypothetical protein
MTTIRIQQKTLTVSTGEGLMQHPQGKGCFASRTIRDAWSLRSCEVSYSALAASMATDGGHEKLPGDGHVAARWRTPELPGGGQQICPTRS